MVRTGNNTRRNARKHTHTKQITVQQTKSRGWIYCTHTERDKTIRHRWNKRGWEKTIRPGREGTKGGSVEQEEGNKSSKWCRKQQAKRINKNLKHIFFIIKADECQEPLKINFHQQLKRSNRSSPLVPWFRIIKSQQCVHEK